MLRYFALLSCLALTGCLADRPGPTAPSYAPQIQPQPQPPPEPVSMLASMPDSMPASPAPVSETAMSQSMEMSKKVAVAHFSDSAQTGSSAGSAPAAPPPPPPPAPASVPPPKQEAKPSTTLAPHERNMLVYTARYTLSVYQVEQGLAKVEQIAKDAGGYLSVRNDRDITVRVPRERFEEALAAIDKIGDVLHRDVQALDVTDKFVDMEIRIKNGHAMQTRLKSLLDKATVKEALELEKELKRVTEELELLEGKLKLLSAQIAYSTVTVMFQPHGAALTSAKVHLPFPWLGTLGLPALLRLSEFK